jgi:hypothetical protein
VADHIIVTGDVVNGLRFYGPFDSADDAGDWAAEELKESWLCVKLVPVAE